MAKAYNSTDTNDTSAINKDIFFLMVIIMELRSNNFEYSSDIDLTDKDKKIIENLRNKINLYIKIFIPSTSYIYFAKYNYYKKNHLNELPQEIRQLIAVEYIKGDLAEYSLSSSCIKSFSNEIAKQLFNKLANEHSQAQSDFEKGPHFYEIMLFSSILDALKESSRMIEIYTSLNTNVHKPNINKDIFRHKFLSAFEKAKLKNEEITSLDCAKRLKLYEITKQYGSNLLTRENTLKEEDFAAIFEQTRTILMQNSNV